MEIQDRIKERRKSLGLTLKDVAKALGVTEATVSRYETGEIRNVKLNNFAELARVLKCTPGYLMGWEDSPDGTAASGTAAPVSSIDERKNRIDHYYPLLSETSKDELLKRCEELLTLDQVESGKIEASNRSFTGTANENIA